MADVIPLKKWPGGIGEFETGDTLPKAALPALSAADVGAATAAQGGLADTAVQPADIADVVRDADPRLTDSRAPTGVAGGVLSGSYPNPGFAVDMATQAELEAGLAGKVDSNDPRLSDAREWSAGTVAQAEAESGTETTRRAWTAQRVRQAVVAWWNSVSSAWGRSFVSSADAAAGRTALELGNAATATVQTSAYDTTAGALMSVGAFGLGSGALSISQNLNNELRSSFFRVEPSTLNRPPEVNYGHAVVCAISAEAAQSVIDIVTGDLWTRKLQAGVGWSNWRKHFHTGNILGTVSQSGGVPTGAIIERGSNANGEYVRFADGTQICTVEIALPDINQTVGSFYRSSNDVAWQFPVAFTSTPSVGGTPVALTGAWIAAGESSNNATTAYIRGIWHASITANISVRISAIGRWY